MRWRRPCLAARTLPAFACCTQRCEPPEALRWEHFAESSTAGRLPAGPLGGTPTWLPIAVHITLSPPPPLRLPVTVSSLTPLRGDVSWNDRRRAPLPCRGATKPQPVISRSESPSDEKSGRGDTAVATLSPLPDPSVAALLRDDSVGRVIGREGRSARARGRIAFRAAASFHGRTRTRVPPAAAVR